MRPLPGKEDVLQKAVPRRPAPNSSLPRCQEGVWKLHLVQHPSSAPSWGGDIHSISCFTLSLRCQPGEGQVTQRRKARSSNKLPNARASAGRAGATPAHPPAPSTCSLSGRFDSLSPSTEHKCKAKLGSRSGIGGDGGGSPSSAARGSRETSASYVRPP